MSVIISVPLDHTKLSLACGGEDYVELSLLCGSCLCSCCGAGYCYSCCCRLDAVFVFEYLCKFLHFLNSKVNQLFCKLFDICHDCL